MDAPMLTAREVADLLKLSPNTVYDMAARGQIPEPARIGRTLRWERKRLQRWLTAGCPDPSSWDDTEREAATEA